MTTFPDTFRAIVVPDLRRMCRFSGYGVANGISDYSETYYRILHHAIKHGALLLPDPSFKKLEDWIATTLLKSTVKFEAIIWEREAAATRREMDDLHEATLEPA